MPVSILSRARPVSVALCALPPLALYVHVPWCVRKCPYCDFNSHELKTSAAVTPSEAATKSLSLDPELEREYVRALIADLDSALPSVWGRRLSSVFFGGGTPSLLSAEALDLLLSAIRARLTVDPNAEITLEANPGTFETRKFADFRAAGVNRLSIGIQSFNQRHLRAIGRIHDDAEARNAIAIAQRSFDNINLDLMYALPEQTSEQALQDVQEAAEYGVQHISAYHLTLEPNTLFYRHPPRLPADDTAADMQAAIEELLASHGYRHYETSAFAQPGRESRHNLNYWTFGDYLGIGAGAHSKLSFSNGIVREMRYKHPREYLRNAKGGTPLQTTQEVAPDDLPFEFMMNALRLVDGFPLHLFVERTGLPAVTVHAGLRQAEQIGLIERDHVHVKPTLRGQRFLNDLLQLFLSAQNGNRD
ncbi:MAG: radical SAM family heme chaperone HemW [Burkholderiales bacterium]